VFYHDALSLMTCKKTVEWMKSKGYYSRWLVPICGLNAGTDFACRPPGNSPELMPLDNNLNKDLHDAVGDHVRKCSAKFSRSTWQRQTEAYLRVWEVAPPSKRIIEDVDKVFAALPIIYQAKGVTTQGLGERNGKRKAAEASGVKAKRGGARQKGERKKASLWEVHAGLALED